MELALFGSVVRDGFGPESDVDVLVGFDPNARHTLFDMSRMQDELTTLLGRQADIVERVAVEQSPNYLRRKEILQSFETILCDFTTPTYLTCCQTARQMNLGIKLENGHLPVKLLSASSIDNG